MRADDGPVGVVCNATDESLERRPQRLDVLNHIFAESEGLNAAEANISLRLGRVHLESQAMCAMEVEDLEVLNLSVGEKDDILAHLALRVCRRDVYVESCLADLLVLEGDLLEAAAFVSHLWVSLADLRRKDWQEHHKAVGRLVAGAVRARGDWSHTVGHFSDLCVMVLSSMAQEGRLLIVVHMVGQKRCGDCLLRVTTLLEDLLLDEAAELVLGDVVVDRRGIAYDSCGIVAQNRLNQALLGLRDGDKSQKACSEGTHINSYLLY